MKLSDTPSVGTVPRMLTISPQSLCNLPPGAGVYQCSVHLIAVDTETLANDDDDQRIIMPKSPSMVLSSSCSSHDCQCTVVVEIGGHIHVTDDRKVGLVGHIADVSIRDNVFLAIDFE